MSEGYDKDTIFAMASGRGRAGVAVFRISGPAAVDGVSNLCNVPAVGARGLRVLKDRMGAAIDEALVLHFAQKASFTGESVVGFVWLIRVSLRGVRWKMAVST